MKKILWWTLWVDTKFLKAGGLVREVVCIGQRSPMLLAKARSHPTHCQMLNGPFWRKNKCCQLACSCPLLQLNMMPLFDLKDLPHTIFFDSSSYSTSHLHHDRAAYQSQPGVNNVKGEFCTRLSMISEIMTLHGFQTTSACLTTLPDQIVQNDLFQLDNSFGSRVYLEHWNSLSTCQQNALSRV